MRSGYNAAMEAIGGVKSGKAPCASIQPDAACRTLMPAAPAVIPPNDDRDDSDENDQADGNEGNDGDDGDGYDNNGCDDYVTHQGPETQYSIESSDGASPTLGRMYVRARMCECFSRCP